MFAEQLCDAVLIVSDMRFPVHRAVLAANSPYFRALFTNGMKETGQREVYLTDVEPQTIEQIIDYIYTRSLRITTENVSNLLEHADSFLISGLVDKCSEFLKTILSDNNCIQILRFSRRYFRQELESATWRFILANFVQLTKISVEFLHLSPSELLELVRDDALNVKTEEETFEAVTRWIDFDNSSRSKFLPELMKQMRLGLLTTEYFLDKVTNHPYVGENAKECEKSLSDAWDLMYCIKKQGTRGLSLTNPMVRPRIPYGVLFAIGGWSGE